MRNSYTVTLPASPLPPGGHKELRPRPPLPGSLLLSTFVGLMVHKAKERLGKDSGLWVSASWASSEHPSVPRIYVPALINRQDPVVFLLTILTRHQNRLESKTLPPASPLPKGPVQPNSKTVQGLTGLRNLGNTCFMNSILQCLSNTKELRDYCLQSQYVRDLNNNSRMQMSLMTEFAKLIQMLWTSSPNESVSPSEFKMQIQRYAPRFVGYNQQDAQEFLRFLLDGLHSEVNRVLVRPKGHSDNLDHLPDDEKGRQMWMRYLAREDSRIGDLFVGQLKSSLTCSSCGYCSTAFDPFWDLSLPIAKKSYGEVNLIDCMRLFTKEDVLDGDEKPTCGHCKARTKCMKKFSIQRFPKILVLRILSFCQRMWPDPLIYYEIDFSPISYPTTMGGYLVRRPHLQMSGDVTGFCQHPSGADNFTGPRIQPVEDLA
ncbi:hypothetical protein Chor_005673 [Crotalus horridus]